MWMSLFSLCLMVVSTIGKPSSLLWALVSVFLALTFSLAGWSALKYAVRKKWIAMKSQNIITKELALNTIKAGQMMSLILTAISVGWLIHDAWEYHHTYIFWDMTVKAEPGDTVFIQGRPVVVPLNTFYLQKSSGPQNGEMIPHTYCNKFVPGLHDGYQVEVEVSTIEQYPSSCWNVSKRPLGIVYNQGG